jgi:acyl-CoA reductase-like NAD-dependent aldehyde dehydrogenase
MIIPNGRVSLPVRNPYTGEVDYEITPPAPEELATTCQDLRAAQATWAAAPLGHRAEEAARKAQMTQSAPPAPLARPAAPGRPA